MHNNYYYWSYNWGTVANNWGTVALLVHGHLIYYQIKHLQTIQYLHIPDLVLKLYVFDILFLWVIFLKEDNMVSGSY